MAYLSENWIETVEWQRKRILQLEKELEKANSLIERYEEEIEELGARLDQYE